MCQEHVESPSTLFRQVSGARAYFALCPEAAGHRRRAAVGRGVAPTRSLGRPASRFRTAAPLFAARALNSPSRASGLSLIRRAPGFNEVNTIHPPSGNTFPKHRRRQTVTNGHHALVIVSAWRGRLAKLGQFHYYMLHCYMFYVAIRAKVWTTVSRQLITIIVPVRWLSCPGQRPFIIIRVWFSLVTGGR